MIAMTRAASISGRVLDPAGDPIGSAQVRLVPEGEPWKTRAARSTSTDDRGWYVIDGLVEGRYAIGAARSIAELAELSAPAISTS